MSQLTTTCGIFPSVKASNPNRLLAERLRANEQRFAALARQLADDADAGKPYGHILHELSLARHMETTGHA